MIIKHAIRAVVFSALWGFTVKQLIQVHDMLRGLARETERDAKSPEILAATCEAIRSLIVARAGEENSQMMDFLEHDSNREGRL